MPRALVVYNPVAGGSRGASVSELAQRRLRAAGFTVDRSATIDRAGAAPLAAQAAETVDRIVAVGGDGTLREVVEGLGAHRRRVDIGIVPMGNANVVAHEMGIPTGSPETIELLATGTPTAMDVGTVRVDGRESLFLAMVGVGWDAATVDLVDRFRHTTLGRRAYRSWADGLYGVAGLLSALHPRQARVAVHVDGVPMPRAAYRAAFFCNLRTYGKAMSVAPDAHRRSGLIHAQARKYASPPALAVQLGAALAHRPAPAFVSDHATGARFEIVSDRPFPVQVDGDARGRMRALTVGVLPSEIRILAPAGRALTAPDPTADER